MRLPIDTGSVKFAAAGPAAPLHDNDVVTRSRDANTTHRSRMRHGPQSLTGR